MKQSIKERSIHPDDSYGKWRISYSSEELRQVLIDAGVKDVHHEGLDNLILTSIAPEIFPHHVVGKLTEREGFGSREHPPFHPTEGGILSGGNIFEGFRVEYVVHHQFLGLQPMEDRIFSFFLQQEVQGMVSMSKTTVSVTLKSVSPVYVPTTPAYATPEITSTSRRSALDELCTFILGECTEEIFDLSPPQLRSIKFLNDCVRPVDTVDTAGHLYFRVNDPTPYGIEQAAKIFSRIVACVDESKALLKEYERIFLEPDTIERLRTAKKEVGDSLCDAGVGNIGTLSHSFTHFNSLAEQFIDSRRKEIDERKKTLPAELTARFDTVRKDIVQYMKRKKYELN